MDGVGNHNECWDSLLLSISAPPVNKPSRVKPENEVSNGNILFVLEKRTSQGMSLRTLNQNRLAGRDKLICGKTYVCSKESKAR